MHMLFLPCEPSLYSINTHAAPSHTIIHARSHHHHTHARTRTRARAHTHTHARTHRSRCTSTALRAAPLTLAFLTTGSHSYARARTHAHAHTHTHTRTHTHTHTHAQVTLYEHSLAHGTPDACFPNNWFSTHPRGEALGGVSQDTLVLYPMKVCGCVLRWVEVVKLQLPVALCV